MECIVAMTSARTARSPALLGFGGDSFIELLSAIIVFRRFRSQSGSADAETVTARVAGALLLALAVLIVAAASSVLFGNHEPQPSLVGITILILAAFAMPWLATQKRKLAAEIGSVALKADAVESAVCGYMAWIALAGLLTNAIFHKSWADPVAALALVPQGAGEFLCAFGTSPYWTWMRVFSDIHSFRSWLIKNSEKLKALSFGNHRKYEAKKPLILHGVVASFLDCVKNNGDTPKSAFRTSNHGGPEANFHALYHSLKNVFRFGRTGAFDLLCLLGNIDILRVRAGSCYLPGSTGPLKGARKLWGMRPPKELGRLADSKAQALGIPFEVFEDALCMWQK